jgi:hypothetical protein
MATGGAPEDRPDRLERAIDAALSGTLYGASLPERALRAMVGAAGGVLRESARAAVPDALKGSKLYELTVRKMLRFLVEDVGGLEGACKGEAGAIPGPTGATAPALAVGGTEYVVKKALGNAVDIAGLAVFHVSPLWVVAIFSDIAYGARSYLNALGEELRRTGVIAPDARFEGVDGLLAALGKVSGTVADGLDTPPVTIAELEKMVRSLREESARVDLKALVPQEGLEKIWKGIEEAAAAEGRSPFEISNALAVMVFAQISRLGMGAVGSVKVGLDLLHDNVIDYYLDSLAQLHEKGYYGAVADAAGPYVEGLRLLFDPSRETYTEKVLTGKLFALIWAKLKGCCRRRRRRGGPLP